MPDQYCIICDDEDANGPWAYGPFPTMAAAANEIRTQALNWLKNLNDNLEEGQAPYVIDDDYGDEQDHIEIKDDCDNGKIWWSIKLLNPPQ